MGEHWIAGAVGKKGALHREMGIPEGQKIPHARLAKAADAGGKLGERARLAETLEKMPHRAWGGPMTPHTPTVVGERGPEIVTSTLPAKVTPVDGTPDIKTPMVPTHSGDIPTIHPAHRLRMAILQHLGGSHSALRPSMPKL